MFLLYLIIKKIFILLVLSFIFVNLSILVVEGEATSKIVFETIDNYEELSLDHDNIDSSSIEEVVIQIRFKTDQDLEDLNIDINKNDIRYRTRAKQYFYNLNLEKFRNVSINNYKSFYISKYSPYIEYIYEKDKFYINKNIILSQLESNSDIETVYIKEYFQDRPEQLQFSLLCADSLSIYRNRTYTGEGVTVGVLEPGIVDTSIPELSQTTCLVHNQDNFTEVVTEHATLMASFIAAEEGVAPDATILSSHLTGSPSEEIEWMIDNNVDIINMSFGETNPTGVYGSDSAYMDYIVRAYGVIIVASTGNNSGYVGNPGLGYNVISVGSADEFINMHYFSSYLEASGPEKPTIVIHGSSTTTPLGQYGVSGTSISSAIATGIITLILEKYPNLKGFPEKIMAVITSSAQHNTEESAYNQDNGFSDTVGAGMFHWNNFITHYINSTTIRHVMGTNGSCIYSLDVDLEAGEEIKASIAWTAYTNGTVDSLRFTNYDFKITDSNGNVVAQSLSTSSTIELITYKAPTAGTYKLRIYQIGSIQKLNEDIVLSYGPSLDYANQ